MASAMRRRAAASVVATVRGTVSGRPFSSVAAPRLPAVAATKATALRLSSAAATIRSGPTPVAARLRSNHTHAYPERIERLKLDFDHKLTALREELQGGSAEMERGVRDALRKAEVAQTQAYDSIRQGQARHNKRFQYLADWFKAEGNRSVHRANISSAESARSLAQVGRVPWWVVLTVVGASGITAISTAQLLEANTTASQHNVAANVVRERTAELQEQLTTKLEQTVVKSIEVALAREARRRTLADEETLHAFASRIDDLIKGLDDKIERAVDGALANKAIEEKKKAQGGGWLGWGRS